MPSFEPAPDQVVTVFRSRLRPDGAEAYGQLAPDIERLARSMPGLIDVKSFTAEDGERVTIVTFADDESQSAWRQHPEHLIAQGRGRSEFYDEFSLQVCRTERVRAFRRDLSAK